MKLTRSGSKVDQGRGDGEIPNVNSITAGLEHYDGTKENYTRRGYHMTFVTFVKTLAEKTAPPTLKHDCYAHPRGRSRIYVEKYEKRGKRTP